MNVVMISLLVANIAVAINSGQHQMVVVSAAAQEEAEKQHHHPRRSLGNQNREMQTSFSTKSGIHCYSGDGANHTYGEFTNDFGMQNPIYQHSEFTEDFLDENTTGYGFGACSRMINGNFLGFAYVCQNKTLSENCVCLAEYNVTACSSCTVCNASAPPSLENFEVDCSNVNGKCKIECGQGVGTTLDEDNVTTAFTEFIIVSATMDVCPYPNTSFPSPSESSPPPPSSTGAIRQHQWRSTCWTLSFLVLPLFWIY
jgi:hypothetical protein